MSDTSGFLDEYRKTLRAWVADTDLPPEIKEKYVFDSLIKQHDGREVYFVTKVADGARAVLRVSKKGDAAAIEAEKAILGKLNHPAIPRLFGAFEHHGRGYLIRECFEGEDLYAYVCRHGPMSVDELLSVAHKLCDILIYLHGQRPPVIHRDIKPENIILTAKKEIRLVDFGIARTFRDDTDTDTQVIGTKPYMAPEQFGSEQTDSRADLYAVGMLMLFLGTGAPDKRALKTSYPYKQLLPVIEKCIRKDRDQRFRSAAELKRRLLWIERRTARKVLAAAGLLILLSAVFLTGFYFGRKQGFHQGIASILDTPSDPFRWLTEQERIEPVTFVSEYLELAVRNVLNKQAGETIYRAELSSQIDALKIYGTMTLHPDLEDRLQKYHVDKGVVNYITDTGFHVYGRGDIDTLDDISSMTRLTTLLLTSQHIVDLKPLAGLRLTTLNLADNFIGNLLPLKDMVTLKSLDVTQNPLRDLWPISRLLSLQALDASQTQVRDLSPIKDLVALETLSIAYCDVTDLSVLAFLPNLREVDLRGTKVKDLKPLLREENPVTVYCEGLPEKTLQAVRDNPVLFLSRIWIRNNATEKILQFRQIVCGQKLLGGFDVIAAAKTKDECGVPHFQRVECAFF